MTDRVPVPDDRNRTIEDAAPARFLMDPIFHAKVVTLARTILQVVETADHDYDLDAMAGAIHSRSPSRTRREVREDQLLLAIARWATENP